MNAVFEIATKLIDTVFGAHHHPSQTMQEAREMACSGNLTDDQLRALIWAEQAGLSNTRIHELPCFREKQPAGREGERQVGFYFGGL